MGIKITNQQKIEDWLMYNPKRAFRAMDILKEVPEIHPSSIANTLEKLRQKGILVKIGIGKYIKNVISCIL